MKCPKCNSNKTIKNGRRRGKQSYRCHDCGRQFIESPIDRSYPPEVKQLWTVGDRSSKSFQILLSIIRCWHSFWYVTDGWKVYPGFIEPEDHLVCKTYMTRVEGENTRLRHYLARLHRKTLCYSKSLEMLRHSIRLLLHYLKFQTINDVV